MRDEYLLIADPQRARKLSVRKSQFLSKEPNLLTIKTFSAGKAHQITLDLAAPQALAYVIVSDRQRRVGGRSLARLGIYQANEGFRKVGRGKIEIQGNQVVRCDSVSEHRHVSWRASDMKYGFELLVNSLGVPGSDLRGS